MKLLCLTIAVVFLVSSLEASPGPVFNNKPVVKYAFQSLNKFFSLVTEKENFASIQHRQKRQANPQCFRDIQETEGQRFRFCNQVLQMFGDGNLTANATDSFCRQRCPSYLIFLSERLARDCDFPDALDPSVKTFINQSCDQGPNNTPCISLWSSLQSLSNTSTEAVTYNKCLQENRRNSKICNTDCKTSELWIEDNLGCCYRALVDYDRSIGITDGILKDDNWDICNVKEPDACTRVAPIRPTRPPRTPPPTRRPPITRGPPITRRPPLTRSPRP